MSSILVFLGNWLASIVLALAGVSSVGFVLSFKRHRNPLALSLALFSGGILFYSHYVVVNRQLGYMGSAILIAAVIADYVIRKRHKASYNECDVYPRRQVDEKGIGSK